jgi:hypothetical protein
MTSTTGPTWLKNILARPKSATPAAAATAAQPAPAAPAVLPLALLAAALRAPHGASPEELAAAIAGNKARPDLDPELVDDEGFPVTSARCDDAADETVKEEIVEWLVLSGMAELHWGDAQWRALTLGTAVVRDLAGEALAQLMSPEGTPPQLRLLPILPSGWTVEQRQAAGLWFRHTVAQFGWPVDYLTRIDVAREPGAAVSALLHSQFAPDSAAPSVRQATIVIACESNIDQETIDTWAANKTLFTPTQPQGVVPGEGAAGLLMTALDYAQSLPESTFTLLDPLNEARLPSAADENRRPDVTLLGSLAQQACKDLDLANVGMIAADAGQRLYRVRELMAVASTMFPHLEDTTDVACVGISSGRCGAVPTVTALALAQQQAGARGAPVLYVINEEPHACYAALVHPTVAIS